MRWRPCFLVLALLPSSVLAQVGSDSIISVTASRSVRIAPDRASVYVYIEGSAETAMGAVARAEAKVKGVSDALRAPETRVEAERPIAYSVGPTRRMWRAR